MTIFHCKLGLHCKTSRSVLRVRCERLDAQRSVRLESALLHNDSRCCVKQLVGLADGGGSSRTDHRSAEAGSSQSARANHIYPYSCPCRTMFHCRRNVSGAFLFLRRLNFSGSPQLHGTGGASCSLRHYRAIPCWRVYRSKAAVSSRPCSPRLEHEIPLGSSSGLVARAQMAAFALNATRYSDARNIASSHTELESLLSVRSSAAVVMQTRRSSTTPEKTREERAAQTDHVSSVSSAEGQGSDGKHSKTQQLRKVFKEYGAVGVSFHIGISLISLGIFYLSVSSGLDVAALLCRLGFSESVVQSKLAAGTSTFVLAYAVHKLFAPLRISITLVSVPLIVRHLRKTGLFKPRTSGP